MKKMITCGFLLPIATLALIACSGNNDLTNQLKGSWVAPINGMPEQMEGFELKDNGLASSINMATLVYEKWETIKLDKADALVLQGKSIGNGQTLSFSDTLKIDKISENSLTLTQDSYTRTYTKK
ncbi:MULTISPECIES: lipocalin family protein [Parabacteroides]|uniref:lipocalin family protein n=1 Tax=Parabacteroides TaxID=375288 RepID=UPI00240E14B3|nr:lipocalin family protein [Parabacteroides chongii]WFE84516.1 lipocalin family protein [Parabacteroides chongii]